VLAWRDDWVQLAAACSTHALLRVKRILLTGMSGTGKSIVVRELAARGFKAVDTNHGWSEPVPGGRQRCREDVIQALLATEETGWLRREPGAVLVQFDQIVRLSVLRETVLERLAVWASNPYGKAPEELSRILDDLEAVEPLLRRVADHEICATIPLNEVVTTILRLLDA
jgi:hypothetical protein